MHWLDFSVIKICFYSQEDVTLIKIEMFSQSDPNHFESQSRIEPGHLVGTQSVRGRKEWAEGQNWTNNPINKREVYFWKKLKVILLNIFQYCECKSIMYYFQPIN